MATSVDTLALPVPSGSAFDTDASFQVHEPATGQLIGEVPDYEPGQATALVDSIAASAEDWAGTTPRARSEVLSATHAWLTARADAVAALISRESGKTLSDARAEVAYGSEFLRWFAEEAVRTHGRYQPSPSDNSRIVTMQVPAGPCVLVTPWNFPLAMLTRKVGPALAAGCTAVVKPARQTPFTALLLAQALRDCGLPEDVLRVATTTDSGGLVSALIEDSRTRKLSFTGSTAVGRDLLRQCAGSVMRTSMELGGNAALILFEDADLDLAVEQTLIAKLRNGGESCIAANRIYAHGSILEPFSQALAERMSQMRVGTPLETAEVGALIDEQALGNIERMVAEAREEGASLLTGGRRVEGEGLFYEPTLLVDVPPTSRLLREEIFGPVAPIMRFEDEDEVIEAANHTEYGLAAYAFTANLQRAWRLADRLEAGMLGINRGLVSDVAAPFGGVKESGLGREGGLEGILEYCETRYVLFGQ